MADAPETRTRLEIDLGPVRLPPEVVREVGDKMLALVTEALARLDLATRSAKRLPPGTYGYLFDEEVPGGPWHPIRPLDVDEHPF